MSMSDHPSAERRWIFSEMLNFPEMLYTRAAYLISRKRHIFNATFSSHFQRLITKITRLNAT